MNRRSFVKKSAIGFAGLSTLPYQGAFAMKKPGANGRKMVIGTPVLPEYLFENGIENCLDQMQEWAGINTVMTFSHDHVFNQYEKDFRPKTDNEGNPYTNTWVHTNPGYYEKNYMKILFGDAKEEYSYPMYLSMLGYDPEKQPSLKEHRQKDTSFTHDYVYQECRRAVEGVNGQAKVQARPGFDMPGYECNVSPEEVYQAVTRALDAGVDGLWCGREWDELKPENAKAFGRAVKDYYNS